VLTPALGLWSAGVVLFAALALLDDVPRAWADRRRGLLTAGGALSFTALLLLACVLWPLALALIVWKGGAGED
jgi:hypothetical protein